MKRSFRIDHAFLYLLLGRRWRERMWASKADAKAIKTQVIVSGAPFISHCDSVTRIRLVLDLPNHPFNPGLLKLQNGILISYGVGDRVTRLMKIPNAVIEKFLSI